MPRPKAAVISAPAMTGSMRESLCSRQPYGYSSRKRAPSCSPAKAVGESVALTAPTPGWLPLGLTISSTWASFSTTPVVATVSSRSGARTGTVHSRPSVSAPAAALNRNTALPGLTARHFHSVSTA